jgi:DNA-binding PadR family transcriptional regulator
MSIKHAILGLLAGGPLHGYDLKTAYESEVAPSTQLNFGQVYATLDRLHKGGLVTPERISQLERPDKKVYSLTEAGQRELRDWLKTASDQSLDLRNETFLKLMLAKRLREKENKTRRRSGESVPGPREIVAVERRSCFERLHELGVARTQAGKEEVDPYAILLLDLAILRLEAFSKWLDRCEEVFDQEKE